MPNTFTMSASGSGSKFRRLALAACVAVSLAPLLSSPAAAANFFEAIFGRGPSRPVYAPQPGFGSSPREVTVPVSGRRKGVKQGIRKDKPKSRITRVSPDAAQSVRPAKIANVRPPVLAGPLGPFLLDTTLRRGDVVVTSAGLKVFTGGGNGNQHAGRDFSTLSQAVRYLPGNSATLRAIERANRLSFPAKVEMQSVPAQKPAPAAAISTPAKDRQAAL